MKPDATPAWKVSLVVTCVMVAGVVRLFREVRRAVEREERFG